MQKQYFYRLREQKCVDAFPIFEKPRNSLIVFVSECLYISKVHQILHANNTVKTDVLSVP